MAGERTGEARGSLIQFFRTRNVYNFRGKFLFQKEKTENWGRDVNRTEDTLSGHKRVVTQEVQRGAKNCQPPISTLPSPGN